MESTIITVNGHELLKAMKMVAPAKMDIREAYVFPCYKAWVFSVDGDTLHIETADAWQVYMKASIKLDKPAEGDCTRMYGVSGYELKKLLELIDEEPVELTFYNSQVKVKMSRGEYYIPLMDVNEWKRMPDMKGDAVNMTLEVPDLKKWLSITSFCMADDELRVAMNGILIDVRKIGKGINVVATNGYILSRIKVVTADIEDGACGSYIIPAKVVKILQRVLPNAGWVDMELYDKIGIIRVDNLELHFKPIDSRYPDYIKVIPSEGLYDIRVNRYDLLHLVQRLRLFASDSGKLKFMAKAGEQHMTVKAEDNDFELSGQETIDVIFDKMPEELLVNDTFVFGLNARLMEKLLKAIKVTEVLIRVKNSSMGFLIQDAADKTDVNEWQYLVMPMHIEN